MSGILFDPESAKRIANATRGWEREQGAEPPIGYQPNDYGRLMMVQTGTLPSGYTGAMAVHGNVIEKTPAGLIRVIAPIWIKDLNNGALAANTIYYGRIGGSFTQDYTVNGTTTPTTLGLYLVQVGSGGGGGAGIGAGSFISGKTGVAQDGTYATIEYRDNNNNLIVYKILNVLPTAWQLHTVQRYASAIVVDPVAKTSNLVFYTPVAFMAECKKTSLYNAVTVDGDHPVNDPLWLMQHFAVSGHFNALLFDLGQPGFPPVIGMVTNVNWMNGIGTNPFWPDGSAPVSGGAT